MTTLPGHWVVHNAGTMYFNTELRELYSRMQAAPAPEPSSAFLRNPRYTVRAKVLAALTDEWWSPERVALESRVGLSSSRRVLNALHAARLVEKEWRPMPGCQNRQNVVYRKVAT